MFWDGWLRRGRILSANGTWLFSGPDASGDECKAENCGRRRDSHDGADHRFKED